MDVSKTISRRAAFLGAAASTIALAVPVTKTIAAAHGHFVSDQDFALLNFIKTAPLNARAFYHATEFAKALQQVSGGGWNVTDINDTERAGATTRPKVVMFVQHPRKTGVSVPDFNFG